MAKPKLSKNGVVIGRPPKPMAVVFWAYVSIKAPSQCWPWTGAVNVDGYGRRGKPTVYAHRHSWEIHNGRSLADDECVLHSCDNPSCVNPAHLSVGSKADNNRDRAAKGRSRDQHGERHNMAKLTEADVIEIRQLDGESHSRIAQRYGVSQTVVSAIKRRAAWAHVPESGPEVRG